MSLNHDVQHAELTIPAESGCKRVMTVDIKRLAFIDALRGYAILGVIIVHVGQYVPKLEWPLNVIAIEGARGVQLFFIASALTLMLSWHSRNDGVSAFFIRRIFRIAPMFWLAIALFLSLDGLAPRGSAPLGIFWPHILAVVLLAHGFHPETISSIVPGGSTIAVEMTFYAVFPLLARSLRSWQGTALALAASIVAAALLYPVTIGIFQVLTPQDSYDVLKAFSFAWFPTQLPAFLVGILIFHLMGNMSRPLPRAMLDIGSIIAGVAVITLPLATDSMKVLFVAYVLIFGLLVYCLSQGGGQFLVTAPIRYLGTISYSAYFWHFVVLRMIDWLEISPYSRHYDAPGWLQFLVLLTIVAAFTVVFATVTYRWVEMPMIALGRMLAEKAAIKAPVRQAPMLSE
jgi:peptidoglycan/LPS O-acetylase OafA/YrhL